MASKNETPKKKKRSYSSQHETPSPKRPCNIMSPFSEKILEAMKLLNPDREIFLSPEKPPTIQEFGKYMEKIVCLDMKCVRCQKHLHQYLNPSFPIYDLKCPHCNSQYQVKTSQGSMLFGNNWISVTNCYEDICKIKASDQNKLEVPIFVLIQLDQDMKIISRQSKIWIPKIDSNLSETYYQFESNSFKSTITLNPNLVTKSSLPPLNY